MKEKIIFCGLLCAGLSASAAALMLKESTLTQVINDVTITESQSKATRAAKVQDLFKAPDLIRTGPNSRAELTASDKTITRVGANTVFSFESSGRNIRLEQGSLLFSSPKGKGGGTIKTGGASASVLGTTVIASATADGGIKLIVLEGTAIVKLPNGVTQRLGAGQLVFVLPGRMDFSPVVTVNLGTLVQNSGLVTGFPEKLPSMPKIDAAVGDQARIIQTGKGEDTGLLVGQSGGLDSIQTVDPSLLESQRATDVLNLTKLEEALARDVVVSSSILSEDQLFLPEFPFDGATWTGNSTWSGFVGNNITFDFSSGPVALPPAGPLASYGYGYVNVDYTSRSSVGYFDILAAGTLSFMSSVYFEGPGGSSGYAPAGPLASSVNSDVSWHLRLTGSRGIYFAPGVSLTYYNIGGFTINAGGSLNMNNNSLHDCYGPLTVNANGDINFINSYLDGVHPTINAAGNLNISNGEFYNHDDGPTYHGVPVTLTAGQNLSIDGIDLWGSGHGLSAVAGQDLSVMNVSFPSSIGSVFLEGNTIIVQNVNFPGGSTVNMKCLSGQLAANPNTGAPVRYGDVNYVNGVLFNGRPAQDHTGSAGSGQPIQISPRGQ